MLGQVPPVAQRDVAHVPHSEPVDERHARLDGVHDPRPALVQLDHAPVLGEHDRARRHTRVASELGVRSEHPELAVHRHHGLRADEAEDRPDLLRVPVAGHVHGRDLLVQHLGAGLREPVDRVVDAELVPGTGFADRMTVSPRSTETAGWSWYAIRVSADIGSPWLPVQRTIASCRASCSSSGGRMNVSSGASR